MPDGIVETQYKGYTIIKITLFGVSTYQAVAGAIQSPLLDTLLKVQTWVDGGGPTETIGNLTLSPKQVGQLQDNVNLAKIDVNLDDWFGEQGYMKVVEPADVDRTGNILTFGPAGAYQELQALLILGLGAQMSRTPEGMKLLTSIILKYLDAMQNIISDMQKASASSSMTALINQYACTNIYERMGLISPLNSQRTKKWLDHVWGQCLNIDYFQYIGQGVTTLIQGASYKSSETYGPKGATEETSGAGLGAIAKILGSTLK